MIVEKIYEKHPEYVFISFVSFLIFMVLSTILSTFPIRENGSAYMFDAVSVNKHIVTYTNHEGSWVYNKYLNNFGSFVFVNSDEIKVKYTKYQHKYDVLWYVTPASLDYFELHISKENYRKYVR